jgi:hypothetical protein
VIEIKNSAALTVRIASGPAVLPRQQQAVRHQQQDMCETAVDPLKSCGVVDQLPAPRHGTRRARCPLGPWLTFTAVVALPALAVADTQAGSVADYFTASLAASLAACASCCALALWAFALVLSTALSGWDSTAAFARSPACLAVSEVDLPASLAAVST